MDDVTIDELTTEDEWLAALSVMQQLHTDLNRESFLEFTAVNDD